MYALQQSELFSSPFFSIQRTGNQVNDNNFCLEFIQKQILLKKIQLLSNQNRCLVSQRSQLQTTLSDLRKVMTIMKKQYEEEIEIYHDKNKKLQDKNQSLALALSILHCQGNHLQKCAIFWQEYL